MKNFTKFLSTLSLLLFISINTFSQVSGDVSVGLQVYNKADAGTTLSGSNVTCLNEQSDQGFNARRASYKEPEISNVAENSGNSTVVEGIGAGPAELPSTFNGGSAPTITAISANICAGGSITIKGTNFVGITAASVTIGGTAVTSITSFTSTQIIAVVNVACTGNVQVTTGNGTASSSGTFTSNAIPAAPVVATPINYCLNAVASQLSATGSNLVWGSGPISGTAGGSSILTTTTFLSSLGSNKKTDFTTTVPNVEITTVNYYLPAWQTIVGIQLGIFNSSGALIATSGTVTSMIAGSVGVTITNTFNYTIATAGNYSIGAVGLGTGTIGGDSPPFPITEPTGTIIVTGAEAPALALTPFHCFNNIQFTVNNGGTAPTPSTSVAGTTNYLVSQTVNGCVSPQATIAVIVNPLSIGGAVNSNATVCSGSNSGTLNLTGNTGSVVKWQSSTDGGTTWTDIANTTTSQTYSNLTQTTWGRAVVQSGVCASVNSSNVIITINPVSVGGAVNSNATVCSGSNSGTLNLTGNTGSVVKWQYSTNGGTTWTDIVNVTTSQTYSNISVATQYRAVVQSGTCSSANSSAATINVNPVSVGGTVGNSTSVCIGTNSGTLNLTGNTGSVVKWQSSVDNGITWADVANTTTSLSYSNLTQTTQYRAVVQSGVCTSANSSAATITVNPATVGGTVGTNTTVCSGANTGTVYLTGQTGSVVKWQYSSDGGTSWTDIVNTTTSQTFNSLTQTTIGEAVVQSGVCPSVNSSPVTITVNPPGSWSGSVSTDWNDSRNWLCGAIPTSTLNVMIPSGASYYPIITSGIDTANNVTIQSGGSLTVAGGDLQIFGAITNNSGTLDATTGTIEMKGVSAQTIDGSAFYKNTINNLIVSNTGSGLSVSSSASDTLKITGSLTFGNSTSTLNTGNNITLVSNNAGTANVGIVGSGNTINGNVTVERYINLGTAAGQHAKSWQFLATPTIGQTVKQSWMENGNTPAGYGTQITGTGTGFDATTSAPSLKYYNPANDTWVGVTGTSLPIYNASGYMVFVRGDRSITSYTQPANNTTLRTKGALLTGTLSPISVIPGKYTSIGNPYASPVDFTLITKGAGIDDKFYVWDPYLYGSYGVGGYQTLNSANEWKPIPGGTLAYPSDIPSYMIQSGQAFFVHSTSNASYSASDYELNFEENNKVSNASSINVSRQKGLITPGNRQFFGASLYTGNGPAGLMADGNMVVFDKIFSDTVDGNDALKLTNGGENFGLKRDGKILAIEARAPVVATDTLFYNMTNLRQQAYQLRFAPENMESTSLQAYLIDKFLNTSTPVSLINDTTYVNISVTTDPSSSATGRFEVVFKTLPPVTFTSITAVQKNADIEVDWKVENESGIQKYEVEESGDDNQFIKVATVDPQNNESDNYTWLDLNVTPGYHYYRVHSAGKDGQVQYTQIVKVLIGKIDASISVYPNPIVNGNIRLAFNNEPAGVYGVRLLNSLGQVIVIKVINYGGGSSIEEITPEQQLAKGIYQLEITKPDGTVKVVKVIN